MADQDVWLTFRARLATALRRKDIKQYELAERVGVSPSSVHGWLHEKSVPHGENLMRLATVLGLEPSELVPGAGRLAPAGANAQDVSAYVTGGRVALDEMELLLRDLRARWENQEDPQALLARKAGDATLPQAAKDRKRRSKGG